MKTKIKILIVSCMIATAAITGLNLAQDSNSMVVTLADIAVMAKADGESGGGNEVDCYSSCSFNPFHSFYDCGNCCPMNAKPTGSTSKCIYNAADC